MGGIRGEEGRRAWEERRKGEVWLECKINVEKERKNINRKKSSSEVFLF